MGTRSIVIGIALTAAPLFGGHALASGDRAIDAALQHALDEAAPMSANDSGVMASVSAPGLGIDWGGAAGRFDRSKLDRLKPDQPFRIASITKVFVAAAIFRLIEDGRVELYGPIGRYISEQSSGALRAGGYDPSAIRVQHLLAHTSGLYDYAMDDNFGAMVSQSLNKRWTRSEEVAVAMKYGKPVGRPGERYAYSDTGYVLLGEIIERSTHRPMAEAVRSLLNFNALELKSTYFETLEPAPAGAPPRAHQYYGDLDITDADPSFDLYGGGGLVSTTSDLNLFFRALFEGHVFHRPVTMTSALMTVPAARTDRGPDSNLLATVQFGSRTCWAHGGFWGSIALYCPDIDLAVSVTTNESPSTEPKRERRDAVIRELANVIEARVSRAPSSPASR